MGKVLLKVLRRKIFVPPSQPGDYDVEKDVDG